MYLFLNQKHLYHFHSTFFCFKNNSESLWTTVTVANQMFLMSRSWLVCDKYISKTKDTTTHCSIFGKTKELWSLITQKTGDANPTLGQCWSSICDTGQTIIQHWVHFSCFLGGHCYKVITRCRHCAWFYVCSSQYLPLHTGRIVLNILNAKENFPSKQKTLTNTGSMLVQRRRRWAHIEPTV